MLSISFRKKKREIKKREIISIISSKCKFSLLKRFRGSSVFLSRSNMAEISESDVIGAHLTLCLTLLLHYLTL